MALYQKTKTPMPYKKWYVRLWDARWRVYAQVIVYVVPFVLASDMADTLGPTIQQHVGQGWVGPVKLLVAAVSYLCFWAGLTVLRDSIPSPGVVFNFPDGSKGSAMFYYAPENTDGVGPSQDQGCDMCLVSMLDPGQVDEKDIAAYEDGDVGVVRRWHPTCHVDNRPWVLTAILDTGDGPKALFTCPAREKADCPNQVAAIR